MFGLGLQLPIGGSSDITISAATGLFVETGEPVNLDIGHTLTAGQGSFVETGEDATLTYTAAWSPASLSNKVAWFRGDLGTDTTTNGANVGTWADQFGLQGDFDSSTASVKPTYVSSAINGQPGVKGNSSSCHMISPSSSSWNLTGGFSIVMVGVFNNHTTDDCYISKGNSVNWDVGDTSGVSSPKNVFTAVNTTLRTSPSTSSALADGSNFCMHTSLTSGGTVAWTVNGSSLGSISSVGAPAGNSQGVYLFTRQDNVCVGLATWVEIIVTSAPITGSDATSLNTYLSARYGSPIAFG